MPAPRHQAAHHGLAPGRQSTAVWVYDPATSTIKSQVIQIATADGNDVVVASGLTPGMQVVAAGVRMCSPGQKVTVYQPKRL